MFGTRIKEVIRRIQEVGGESELLKTLGLTQYINEMRSTELQKFLRWKDPPDLVPLKWRRKRKVGIGWLEEPCLV